MPRSGDGLTRPGDGLFGFMPPLRPACGSRIAALRVPVLSRSSDLLPPWVRTPSAMFDLFLLLAGSAGLLLMVAYAAFCDRI